MHKRGRVKSINWAKCIVIACCLWLLGYLSACTILDYLAR